MDPAALERARSLVAGADRIVVLTGAGVSAESGVPTFRGPEGLWRSFRPEELATPGAFERDPRLVWEWYGWRRDRVAVCRPNAAHLALARLALTRAGVRIITQNVDGLHAGAAMIAAGELRCEPGAAMPLELHGSIFRVRCTRCGRCAEHRDSIEARDRESLPRCDGCGALLRPDIVWFGEMLDPARLDEAFGLAARADVCLVVGTSGVVQPAASIASTTAQHGGRIIEVNPEETALTEEAEVVVRGGAVEAVPEIVKV